MVVVFKKCKGH